MTFCFIWRPIVLNSVAVYKRKPSERETARLHNSRMRTIFGGKISIIDLIRFCKSEVEGKLTSLRKQAPNSSP